MEENKTILICGATGFIGRNLLDYYYKQNKYKIKATHFKRPAVEGYDGVEWINCDLRDSKQVQEAVNGVDIILQFAATTTGAKDIVSKPYIHVTDNAVINSLLLREAFEQGIEHFIFPSCTIMYQKSETAIKESDFNPSEEIQSFYYGAGYTKIYLEKMCEFYARLGKTKHTVIRHSNMYGPYDKYDLEKSHVFGATITKVMTSKDGKVNVWGTGEEKRDLLYVEDLVDFIDVAINKQTTSYELVNVGLGKGIKIKDLVYKIVKHSERNLEIIHDLTKPTVPTSLYLDCSRAKELFDWEPKHTLDEGIKKTIEWYKENKIKTTAVIIQSRDRTELLKNTIQMLYDNCISTDNFDIIVVIDDDQIEQYSSIKELYPDTIWLYSKYQLNSWANLKQIQNNFIKENNYYFIWAICDDVYGLKHGWDVAIKKKKHYFKDDLFTMYQSNEGRNINNIYESMFCSPDYTLTLDKDISKNVWMYCEMLPISTKKWIDFMTPIYENGEYGTQHELLTGLIVGLLKRNYNIERLIKCDLYWDDLYSIGGSSHIIDTNCGLKREESFDLLQKNQFKKILPIVEKMYKEIKK
jgi:GDP-L-fucose synthase